MERHSETGLKLIKSSQYVEDSVVTNGPDIGQKLDADFAASVERWKASQPAAMVLRAPSFTQVLVILKDRLGVSRRRVAGRAVELAEEEAARQESTSGSAPDAPSSDAPASEPPASDAPTSDQQAAGEAADSSASSETAAPAEASESPDSESSATGDASYLVLIPTLPGGLRAARPSFGIAGHEHLYLPTLNPEPLPAPTQHASTWLSAEPP